MYLTRESLGVDPEGWESKRRAPGAHLSMSPGGLNLLYSGWNLIGFFPSLVHPSLRCGTCQPETSAGLI